MKKRKFIIGALVAVLLVAVVVAATLGQAAEASLFTLKKGNIQSYLELRGKVELDKKRKVNSRIAGTVDKVTVREGEQVGEDTVLLSLEPKDMDLSFQKSQAAYDAARASAAEVKNSIKPEQVAQASAQLEQAKAALAAEEKDNAYKQDLLYKVKALYQDNAISQQDLKESQLAADSAASSLKNAQEAVRLAQYNLEILQKGAVKEAVDAAEANARQAGLQVEDSRNNLDRTKVYPGMKGTVLSMLVAEGDVLQPGTPLFEIGDEATAFIKVTVLSDDAVRVKEGQKAVIHGEALKDKKITGEVYFVAPKAEDSVSTLGVEQQRVEVRIKFDNSTVGLKAGYGVDVDLITDENGSALFVPYKAVYQKDGRDWILTIKDGRLAEKQVEKGMENKDYIEITGGLAEGDKVVVDPDSGLKPGMRVKG